MSEQKITYPFQVVAEIVKGIAWPIAALIIFFYLKVPIESFVSTLSNKPVAAKEHTQVEVRNVFLEKEWVQVQKRNHQISTSRKVQFKKLKPVMDNKEKFNKEFEILTKKLDILTKKVDGIQKTLPKKIIKQKQTKVVHRASTSTHVSNVCTTQCRIIGQGKPHTTKTVHIVKHSS